MSNSRITTYIEYSWHKYFIIQLIKVVAVSENDPCMDIVNNCITPLSENQGSGVLLHYNIILILQT